MARSSSIKLDVKAGKIYQYKKGKKFGALIKADFSREKIIESPEKEDPPIGFIQGKLPKSVLEWRSYLAFVRLKMSFIYQYPVRGGRSRRGGLVVDFLLLFPPLPRPVFVQGSYWHNVFKNPLEEKTNIDRMMKENKGQFGTPIMALEKDLPNADAAYWFYSKELLHG